LKIAKNRYQRILFQLYKLIMMKTMMMKTTLSTTTILLHVLRHLCVCWQLFNNNFKKKNHGCNILIV